MNNTRLMAMGDSLTAGYGAVPVTGGYAYLLYKQGVYDSMTNTTFANAAVPDSTSQHVLQLQVPSATQVLFPHVIVMTVGGNDLLSIFRQGADPLQVLTTYQSNLSAILVQLCMQLPDTRIYIGNLYSMMASRSRPSRLSVRSIRWLTASPVRSTWRSVAAG